jgi:hypothetical protein
MAYLDVALVSAMVGLVVYGTIRLLTRPEPQRRPVSPAGRWRAAHYDVKGETRVVLQRVSASGVNLVDEHIVASVRIDDPEYDAKFLAAMSTARERQALFEAEED